MLEKFIKHIEANFAFITSKRLLIACSGGMDSVVLSHLMHRLSFDISLAHCNFSLRATESDGDAQFVSDLAKSLDVPFFSETFNTKEYASKNGLSTQMAARDLRYTWFEDVRKENEYDYVLTGHHSDDDLETFFINLSRGTGLRGLTGIPVVNTTVVRPLLPFSRDDILNFAKTENLFWREDSSNASPNYLRNKLRLTVLPKFKALSEKTLQNFRQTQHHLNESERLVEDYMVLIRNLVVSESSEGYHINIQKLQELPNTEALLFELLYPFGFTDMTAAAALLSAQSGKQIISMSHRLIKDRENLILTEIPSEEEKSSFKIEVGAERVAIPIDLKFETANAIGEIGHKIIYVDTEKLRQPLVVRKWRKGDVFQPFGMKGNKKLSKFFKDEKLSLATKEKIWLLCSDDKIVWIIGHRADGWFQVTPSTKNITRISTL